jgi:DNA-binding NarL/FixJ family response regulator
MADPVRIVVIDDHPLYREGIKHTLSQDPSFEVVADGASRDDAVRLAQDLLPDIILLDVSMPGGGIEAATAIGLACPVVKIVMLTVSEDERDVSAALKAGARGYVLKGVGGEELRRTLQAINSGESYVSPSLAGRMLATMTSGTSRTGGDPMALLTAREEQILRLVALGQSNKEVATALDLSEKTVKHYMTNIFQKLQVRNRVEAVLMARQRAG